MSILRAGWRAAVMRLAPRQRAPTGAGERGQTLAEYALILALIAILTIVALLFLGGTIRDLFFDPVSETFNDVLCTYTDFLTCPDP